MEVFEWFLANPDGSDVDLADPRNATELPQFLVDVDDFVGPLYLLLLERSSIGSRFKVFDKTVYRDPRLAEPELWPGLSMKEIKRVDPELIHLLAAVPPGRSDELATAWFTAPAVKDFLLRFKTATPSEEVQAMSSLRETLCNLIALARRAAELDKEVMETFWWETS